MKNPEANQRLEDAVNVLREHFDCVQILASWESDDGEGSTFFARRGSGNWYARQGMAHDFVQTSQSREIASELKQMLDEETEG
jgi:hypothetical protein